MISCFYKYSFERLIVECNEVFFDLLDVRAGDPKGSLPPQPLFEYSLRVLLDPSVFPGIQFSMDYSLHRTAFRIVILYR
jgi:hypothetical protein